MTDYESAGRSAAANWQQATISSDISPWPRQVELLRLKSGQTQALISSINANGKSSDRVREIAALIRENQRLLSSLMNSLEQLTDQLKDCPYVNFNGVGLPRVMAVCLEYLKQVEEPSIHSLEAWLRGVSVRSELLHAEIWLLPQALNFALLDKLTQLSLTILDHPLVVPEANETGRVRALISHLRQFQDVEWTKVLESHIPFEQLLRQDPAGAYSKMDFSSRDRYRRRIVHLSKRSDFSELEVARAAVRLAARRAPDELTDERLRRRSAHVGYYLVGAGVAALTEEINYHATWDEKLRSILYQHPDDVYIGPIVVLSVLFILVLILPLVPNHSPLILLGIAIVLLILPATQGAVDLVNTTVTLVLPAEMLPKMDFSVGIPREFTTLVAIPTLLLSEKQTRDLVHEMEVRYLANRDPNLFFGLITDLPDSVTRPVEEADARVQLAAFLINTLNERYSQARGRFFLLHRHRILNQRQGVWMGWERKRGKLLDLNKLIKGEYDSFPVKAGPVELLADVHFVITLDSDTKLPPTSAYRMIGTLAHPLNTAIIDPKLKIVTEGYAILQPRVGVSVGSATRSRMAAVYSGQTGYDVYTRAVSDAYQDLYGEGSFTGKGIYEVDALHTVLNRRFPRNSLLSHDLIEGAYARVGLVTDVEVIDDFPSHYSAHNRRKHRWVRGDWQILQWLLSKVPDESGRMVNNPISTISRWKIVDNLRRSLVEPVTFVLLVAGWFVLPGGPLYWTLVTLGLLALPAFVQLAFSLGRALWHPSTRGLLGAISSFGQTGFQALLILTFLPHQALLSLDAIVRSLVRSFVTGAHLLEWETAAEAESKSTRLSVVDSYLKATPIMAVGLALLLGWFRPTALIIALPILALWALETVSVRWLNGAPRDRHFQASLEQEGFLRLLALRTWRFFLDYCNDQHRWFIPDNFEEGSNRVAARVSPTNLGLLLNSRQAATELGYISLPEGVALTVATLGSTDQLEKFRGHIYNWYSTETLAPLEPRVISSVDSGNFAASLYVLSAGLRSLADAPIFSNRLLVGLGDHLQLLSELGSIPAPWQALAQHIGDTKNERDDTPQANVVSLLMEAHSHDDQTTVSSSDADEFAYWHNQTRIRIRTICNLLSDFNPWLLPQYRDLVAQSSRIRSQSSEAIALSDIPSFVGELLPSLIHSPSVENVSERSPELELSMRLEAAAVRASELLQKINETGERAFRLAHEMDFQFLVDPQRGLLKIGYEMTSEAASGEPGRLFEACYDLLASEARIATFLAVAKGDIEQDSWFKLGRTHVEAYGQVSLISWTGTMFEYLMPAIWMRSYPETMMTRSLSAAVHAHRAYAADTGRIPWGISECGHAGRDDMGNYGYHAFGVPQLALKWDATAGPVISPYSSCLALAAQPAEATANLQRMAKMGWMGAYGFYEAADYTKNRGEPELVREWMAHHQGMSLAAILNVIEPNIFQDWFHANAHIEAAELILHERPLSRGAIATRTRDRTGTQADLEHYATGDLHSARRD